MALIIIINTLNLTLKIKKKLLAWLVYIYNPTRNQAVYVKRNV
jgi:hypothetical protein